MTNALAIATELMSRVGRSNPNLVNDRQVMLFIDLVIEEGRKADRPPAPASAPLAPCDFDKH
jgi:hypothetical protein